MNMLLKTCRVALLCALILTVGNGQAESPKSLLKADQISTGPRIRFQNPIFDFGKLKSGELARHTFFFTNCGDGLLMITNVQTQCGCTTAGEWTRKVEPGGIGSVPLQFNTLNYNGQVLKTATVNCNDNTQPSLTLQIKGTVWKPIDVQPAFAILNLPSGGTNSVSTTVHIVNHMDDPLVLSEPEANNKMFMIGLKTNVAGRDFSLEISAVPPFQQPSTHCQIKIKSSSADLPPINVLANIQTPSPPRVPKTNLVSRSGPITPTQ